MDPEQFERFMKGFEKTITKTIESMGKSHQELSAKLDNVVDSLQAQVVPHSVDQIRISNSLMTDLTSRIQKFEYDTDSGYQFTKWYERHSGVLTVDGASLDDACRVRLLLERISDDVYEKYKRQILPTKPDGKSFDDTVKLLKEMFDTKLSLHTIRFQCLNIKQGLGENFVTYTGRVNQMCENAQIPEISAEGLKCLIWIIGLQGGKDPNLRAQLLAFLDKEDAAKRKTSLHDLYVECDRIRTLKDTSRILETSSSNVNFVHSKHEKRRTDSQPVCYNCEKLNHKSTECRAPKSKCTKCNREGHREKFCRSNEGSRFKSKFRKHHSVKTVMKEHDEDIEVNAVRRYATVKVNGFPMDFLIDSGADVTLINKTDWELMGKPTLQPVSTKISGPGGENLKILGVGNCKFEYHKLPGSGSFYVVPGRNILGLDWMDQNPTAKIHLDGLVPEVNVVEAGKMAEQLRNQFPDVFAPGLGRCTLEQAHMTLLPDAQPKFCPKRPVPHSALESVEAELNRLQELKVIEPVNHAMWAAPIVTVRKPGKIRVCADFSTGLNKALRDDEFPLPVIEDVFTCLNGGTVFSQIDFSDAYLQVELDEKAKNLIVINTHKGLYKYNRLLLGLKLLPLFSKGL